MRLNGTEEKNIQNLDHLKQTKLSLLKPKTTTEACSSPLSLYPACMHTHTHKINSWKSHTADKLQHITVTDQQHTYLKQLTQKFERSNTLSQSQHSHREKCPFYLSCFVFKVNREKKKKGNSSELLLLLLFWVGRSLGDYCSKETVLLSMVVDKEFQIPLCSNLLVSFLGEVQHLPAVVPLRCQSSSAFTIRCRLHLYYTVYRLQIRLC